MPGIGGQIKSSATDFQVTEIPLYESVGEGEHIVLNILRENMTTKRLQDDLTTLFSLQQKDVGVAGLKDKLAKVTQNFTLHLHKHDLSEVKEKIHKNLDVEVMNITRHQNKLKMGHLRGNDFKILVSAPVDDALKQSEGIRERLLKDGLLNYYGSQRFGSAQDNAEKGKLALTKRSRDKRWLKQFLISAYGSKLFNDYLTRRSIEGEAYKMKMGDVAKKCDNGALFHVEDLSEAQSRFDDKSIVYTGPIYGSKMKWPHETALDLEKSIFDDEKIGLEAYSKNKVPGSRRAGLVYLDEIKISEQEEGLLFEFFLPKGSYATVLLEQFMTAPI